MSEVNPYQSPVTPRNADIPVQEIADDKLDVAVMLGMIALPASAIAFSLAGLVTLSVVGANNNISENAALGMGAAGGLLVLGIMIFGVAYFTRSTAKPNRKENNNEPEE